MLYLRIKAPFAAFRTFTAGSFRPTAPFITPSAAYGLLMNLAGIETRQDDGVSPMTIMRADIPSLEIAIGAVCFPEIQSAYQQLHNYPVGASAKEREEECRGSKYNIQPVRREFLSGIDACIAVNANESLKKQISDGLHIGATNPERYGIPFLGDNGFMPDVLQVIEKPVDAHWYVRMPKDHSGPIDGLCRLTVWIDRANMTKTIAPLFYPLEDKTDKIPDAAWAMVGHS